MQDTDWSRIEDIFHQTRELPSNLRAGYLAEFPEEVRKVVEDLLRCDGESAEETIFRTVGSAAALFSRPSPQVGQWRLVRPIGEGGMGSVYLGVRTDGAFDRKVAIKFVRRGMDSPALRLRLEAERRILARLEHPNIARLLDAGATPEGQPYLVMEYVEGRNILEYCEAQKLAIGARLELFLQVCSAVEYAHRNLVVHRDLKPGNVLVGADGAARLLDFGIAKLLDPTLGATSGVTQLRLMSFEWASPEQIRGEAVTTATDVYSLGAILFHLLTGSMPFALEGVSALEAERIVSQTEAPRVSSRNPQFARQLRGDLDNIVQKALRPNPVERYASVAHMIADIRRHQEGRAIEARDYSAAERIAIFAKRHRVPATAAAVALIGLVAGTGVAVRFAVQANAERGIAVAERARAEAERERAEHQSDEAARAQKFAESKETDAQLQRAAAEAQRIIAERSLKNEQQVLDGVVSGVYGYMMNLPGATGARKTALETVIPPLEKLTATQPDNLIVANLLARAYQRMGEFLAATNSAGFNDPKQGLQYYEKALRITERLVRQEPRNADYLIGRSVVHAQIANLLAQMPGTTGMSVGEHFAEAVASAREAIRLTPAEPEFVNRLADALLSRAVLTAPRPDAQFQADIVELKQMLQKDLVAHPNDADALDRAGRLAAAEAVFHNSRAEWADATKSYERALELKEKASAQRPNDTVLLRSVMIASGNVANGYRRLGGANSAQVAAAYERMAAIAEKLAAFDPEDRTARYDQAMSLQRLGLFYMETKRGERAVEPAERSVSILRELKKQNALTTPRMRNFASALQSLGNVYESQKRMEDARRIWQESLTANEVLIEGDPKDAVALSNASRVALSLAQSGVGANAAEMARKSVALAERLAAASPTAAQQVWLARARGVAALVFAKADLKAEAVKFAGQSAEAQSRIPDQAFGDWSATERAQVKALVDSATN